MSAADDLREYTERSNTIHQEYLGNPELLDKYRHFVVWQLDYMLPFYEDLRHQRTTRRPSILWFPI